MKIYKIWLAFSKQCRQHKISHQRIQRKGEIKMREKKIWNKIKIEINRMQLQQNG